MAFTKLYKGPKRFFPGETLQFSFRDIDIKLDQESLTVLKATLRQRKSKIIEKLQKLFPELRAKFYEKTNRISLPIPELQFYRKNQMSSQIKIQQIF